MNEPDEEYAPQSPDLSAYHSSSYEPQQQQNSYYPQQPYHQPAYNAPPPPSYSHIDNTRDPYSFSNSAPLPPHHQPYQAQQYPTMPRNGYASGPQQVPEGNAEWTSTEKGNRKGKNAQPKIEDCGKPAPGVEEGIEVKTKFPVARIKRIMQADEDVGKVAQVTPTAVSKALELFMISVVTKAANEAKAKSSKRVTAAHLKQAVEKDEQLDFLAEIIQKVPDAPAPKKDESSEEAVEGKRKKSSAGGGGGGGTRRRKKADDD